MTDTHGCPNYTSCMATGKRAAEQGTRILRMNIALKLARRWLMDGGYSGEVGVLLKDWIDGGDFPPVPWPVSPFVQEWLAENGMEDVDGAIGFRATFSLDQTGERGG